MDPGSRTDHPDFLWAAIEKENTEVAVPRAFPDESASKPWRV